MAKTPAKKAKAPATKAAKKAKAPATKAAKKAKAPARKPAKKAKAPATKAAKKAKSPARKPASKSKASKTSKSAGTRARKSTATRKKTPATRTADLSEDVLKSVESGQRAAIDAVRKFVDTVDEALPTIGGRPSRRETVIEAALEMADKLVGTQYEFLRSVVRSADSSLKKQGDSKK